MKSHAVQERVAEARKKLIKENILDAGVLTKKIIPKAAHDAESYDWRYWSAAELF